MVMANRALLVGINAYPGCPLRGCVNDVHNMADYLVKQLGWLADWITILTDADATTANIRAALGRLVAASQPGDGLLNHYSGHGANTPDAAGDESDDVHDVICPVDFDWTPAHMITDKEFLALFSQLPPGVRFNWISDSCHSGHLDRGFDLSGRTAKCFPMPADIRAKIYERFASGGVRRGLVNGLLDVGFVSGCQSSQTSADTVIDGQPAGALTGYLLQSLRAEPPATPLNVVVSATVTALAEDGYDQVPQCDGARAALPLLG
jgi:hypothetical protein